MSAAFAAVTARAASIASAVAAAATAAFIVTAALIPASCATPPGADWRSEVESVLTSQAAAWNRGDIAGYMDGYWRSDSLLFTSGGTIRRGWAQTSEQYAAKYDSREKMGTLTFSTLEYHLPGPGAAWVFGRWELERAGDRPGGLFTVILRQFPGGWKIVHDHTSTDPL